MLDEGVIVAGTDTDVGKTFVAAALLCVLRRRGYSALPMKPVQTGATSDGRAPDLEFILAAAELGFDQALYEHMAPYRLPLPASPHLAARDAGVAIDPARIMESYRYLRAAGRPLVVEGAGGLLVPLADDILQVDLLMQFDLPFALVARAGLGTLNHTLLSVEALRARGAVIARIYLNAAESEWGLIEEDNAQTLARLLPEIRIRRIERQSDAGPSAAARLFIPGGE